MDETPCAVVVLFLPPTRVEHVMRCGFALVSSSLWFLRVVYDITAVPYDVGLCSLYLSYRIPVGAVNSFWFFYCCSARLHSFVVLVALSCSRYSCSSSIILEYSLPLNVGIVASGSVHPSGQDIPLHTCSPCGHLNACPLRGLITIPSGTLRV